MIILSTVVIPFLHEPLTLPEVNRLGLGGTVSPRETPSSPSCHAAFFLAVSCGHRHTLTHM